MWSLVLVTAALASEEPRVQVVAGAGSLHGAYVGSERAGMLGLATRTTVSIGGGSDHVAGGVSLGVQTVPWLQVMGDERYPMKPTVSSAIDLWLQVFPTGPQRYLYGRIGSRLPFRVVGRDHVGAVDTFLGGSAALGAGLDTARGERGWAWGARLELEGHRLGSVGARGAGLSEGRRLDLLTPLLTVVLSYGGPP